MFTCRSVTRRRRLSPCVEAKVRCLGAAVDNYLFGDGKINSNYHSWCFSIFIFSIMVNQFQQLSFLSATVLFDKEMNISFDNEVGIDCLQPLTRLVLISHVGVNALHFLCLVSIEKCRVIQQCNVVNESYNALVK